MLSNITKKQIQDNIDLDLYNTSKPFPFAIFSAGLNYPIADAVRDQIIAMPQTNFDRYENPFEKKFTLRDKNFDGKLGELFQYFESREFVSLVEQLVEYPLELDTERLYWGVHIFGNGDKLDIHTDAGIHPIKNRKKYVTVGLYLNDQWNYTYGGNLEFWSGTDVTVAKPKLDKLERSTIPSHNKLVIFTNTDNAWHGSPDPVECPPEAKRIFVTISYLAAKATPQAVFRLDMKNKLKKARFVGRPGIDSFSKEIEELRLKRADPVGCLDVYRIDSEKKM